MTIKFYTNGSETYLFNDNNKNTSFIVIDRPATDEDKAIFPLEYADFITPAIVVLPAEATQADPVSDPAPQADPVSDPAPQADPVSDPAPQA